MRNKRSRISDRRQNSAIHRTSYQDSHGASSTCRRKMPDRRTDGIQAAMVNLIGNKQKACA